MDQKSYTKKICVRTYLYCVQNENCSSFLYLFLFYCIPIVMNVPEHKSEI